MDQVFGVAGHDLGAGRQAVEARRRIDGDDSEHAIPSRDLERHPGLEDAIQQSIDVGA
jgi:hypothetical protein